MRTWNIREWWSAWVVTPPWYWFGVVGGPITLKKKNTKPSSVTWCRWLLNALANLPPGVLRKRNQDHRKPNRLETIEINQDKLPIVKRKRTNVYDIIGVVHHLWILSCTFPHSTMLESIRKPASACSVFSRVRDEHVRLCFFFFQLSCPEFVVGWSNGTTFFVPEDGCLNWTLSQRNNPNFYEWSLLLALGGLLGITNTELQLYWVHINTDQRKGMHPESN